MKKGIYLLELISAINLGFSEGFTSATSRYETQKRFIHQQENAQKYFVRFDRLICRLEVFIRDMEIARPKKAHRTAKNRSKNQDKSQQDP